MARNPNDHRRGRPEQGGRLAASAIVPAVASEACRAGATPGQLSTTHPSRNLIIRLL